MLFHWHVDSVAHLDVKVIHLRSRSLAGGFETRSKEDAGDDKSSLVSSRAVLSFEREQQVVGMLKILMSAGKSVVAEGGMEREAKLCEK